MYTITNRFRLLLVFTLLITGITLQALTINPFIKSVILPGWGQVSQGKSYGYAMLTGEVAFWSGYVYNDNEQKLKDQSSYDYALKYAHVNPGKYSAQYYRDIAKYNSSGFDAGGYNTMVRETAIQLYPYDPASQQTYIDQNKYKDDMAWAWDSYQLRKKYSGMRKDILELKDQAQLFTGLIIANHIISGIDMLRQRKHWSNVHPSVQYYRNSPALFMNVEF